MKEDYQKALKKLTLFFLSNPVSFNGQNYQKQKGSETSYQSLFRLRNKFRNIPLFIIYYLTKLDDVIKNSFWVIPKITSANFFNFLSNFYFFTEWSPFKNCEKCFLFHLQSSFHSRDIQIVVIFSHPFHTFQIQ